MWADWIPVVDLSQMVFGSRRFVNQLASNVDTGFKWWKQCLLFLVKLKISRIMYFRSVFQFEHNHACVAWFLSYTTHTLHTYSFPFHKFLEIDIVKFHVLRIKYHETPYSCRSVLFISFFFECCTHFHLLVFRYLITSVIWVFHNGTEFWFKIELETTHNKQEIPTCSLS